MTIYIYVEIWNTTRSLFQEHSSLSLDNMVIMSNDAVLHGCPSELPEHSSYMLILHPYHMYFHYKAVLSVNVCHTIIGIHSFF